MNKLIETCIESGPLTLEEIQELLCGKHANPISRAFVSMLEHRIGNVRALAEVPGCARRDELCGAARELVDLRAVLVEILSAEMPIPVNTSGQTSANLDKPGQTRTRKIANKRQTDG